MKSGINKMVASLMKRNNNYVCSACMMKQQCLECTCWFCGKLFSNFEEVAIEEFKKENESDIHRTDRMSDGVES